MDNPAAEWEASCDLFQQFVTKLQRSRAVNVNSSKIKDLLRNAVQAYFRAARPALLTLGLSEQDLEEIDSPLQELLRLAGGNNSARSYRRWIRAARRAIVETTGKVEKRLGHVPMQTAGRNSTEDLIIETLRAMIPSAAASYQQALVDLNDVSRASFRGPAAELREAFREVLDFLAPDSEVVSAPGFKLERDRPKPTLRQKVRFILKARGRGRSAMESPENAAEMIQHGVGDLARSVYTLGALNTHVPATRRGVMQLKRYVETVLMDILEL